MRTLTTFFINTTLNIAKFRELIYLPDKIDSFHKANYRTKMFYIKFLFKRKLSAISKQQGRSQSSENSATTTFTQSQPSSFISEHSL